MEAEEDTSNERVATYKVGMLGASGVGKTALTAQFTTSDYICAYDTSLGECTSRSLVFHSCGNIDVFICKSRLGENFIYGRRGCQKMATFCTYAVMRWES